YAQALVLFRNVVARDADVEPEVELGFGLLGFDFALELAHGALEHRSVELKADGINVAALLAAEQVAGAAQFEVEGGNLESGAQVGEFLKGGQAAPGERGQLNIRGDHEIGIGTAVGASDAAAELVELAEAVAVGAVHDHGIAQR